MYLPELLTVRTPTRATDLIAVREDSLPCHKPPRGLCAGSVLLNRPSLPPPKRASCRGSLCPHEPELEAGCEGPAPRSHPVRKTVRPTPALADYVIKPPTAGFFAASP